MNRNQKLQRYYHLAERFRQSINTGSPEISEEEDNERIALHYELNIDGAANEMNAWANLPIDLEISSSIGHGMNIHRKPKQKGTR